MGEKRDRDVEKVYSTSEFVAKLRRLADALEAGKRFEIQVAGERVYVPAGAEFNVSIERMLDCTCSSDAIPRFKAVEITPVPSGFVNIRTSPAFAPPFVHTRSG